MKSGDRFQVVLRVFNVGEYALKQGDVITITHVDEQLQTAWIINQYMRSQRVVTWEAIEIHCKKIP